MAVLNRPLTQLDVRSAYQLDHGCSPTDILVEKLRIVPVRSQLALSARQAAWIAGLAIRQVDRAGDEVDRLISRVAFHPKAKAGFLSITILIALGSWATDNASIAQNEKADPRRGKTAGEGRRPEFNPIGARYGSFMILPKIETKTSFSSNVFASDTNEVEDFKVVASPSVDIKSDFSRHALDLSLKADLGRHLSIKSEDFDDLDARLKGRVDILSSLTGTVEVSAGRKHESRGSPDDVDGLTPGLFSTQGVKLGLNYKPNRFSADLQLSLDRFDYQDVLLANGQVDNQDDRDRLDFLGSLRLGYEIVPEHEAFAKFDLNKKRMIDEIDDTGLRRNTWGYKATVGSTVELTGLIEGEMSVGYLQQFYSDPQIKGISGPLLSGGLDWHITKLTTLTGDISRSAVDTTARDTSGFLQTDLNLGVSHELLRNLNLSLGFDYSHADYRGIDRVDETFIWKFDSEFFLNRNVFTGFSLAYTNKDTNIATNDYKDFTVTINLGLQF